MTDKALLKDCPFCGCSPEWSFYTNKYGATVNYLKCVNCKANGPHVAQASRSNMVAKKWNDRVSPTEDRLRGIIGELVGKIYALDNWDARSVLDGQALYRELSEAVDRARQEFTDGEGDK